MTWRKLGLDQIFINCIAVNSLGHIFAGTGGNGDFFPDGRIFRSTNNGQTWSEVYPTGKTSGIVAMASNTSNTIFAATFRDGMLRSVNGGNDWTSVNNGPINKFTRTVGAFPWPESSGSVFVGAWDGAFRSTNNAESWELVASKITFVPALTTNAAGHVWAGTTSGVFLSTDKGKTWQARNEGLQDGHIRAITIAPSGKMVAGTARGLFTSTDAGQHWEGAGLTTLEIYTIVKNQIGYWLVGTSDGVYYSADDGGTWSAAGRELQNLHAQTLVVDSLNNIFVGTDADIYFSNDNGATWQPRNISNVAINVNALLLISNREIIAGTSTGTGRLYRSSDAGRNWIEIAAHTIGVFALAQNLAGDIFAGTGNGVFFSRDRGRTWVQKNSGLTHTTTWSLASDDEEFLYAGTDGGGIFRSVATTLTVQERSNLSPASLALSQNYPNPFNPSTTISFSLPRASFVTLKIYNTLGEEVATLVHERREAGEHRVQWQPQNLPSGVYVYRLHAGESIQSKKLLLLK